MSSFLYKSYKNAPFEGGFTPDFDFSFDSQYKGAQKMVNRALVSEWYLCLQ